MEDQRTPRSGGSPRNRRSALLAVALLSVACARERGLEEPATAPVRAGTLVAQVDFAGEAEGARVVSDATAGPAKHADEPLPEVTFREAMPEALDANAPARRYADLSASRCRAEVAKRDLPVAPVKSSQRGVVAALRITGPMNGVNIVTPPSSTKFGVLDCRLALVIDDLTKTLEAAGVVRVSIDNLYRPGAKLPGKKKSSQHALGLAVDVNTFELGDGRVLATSAWGATIGETPCGPDAVMASPNADAVDLRNLVCAIGRAGLFHTVLTPSYDAAHQSHFHFDIKSDTSRVSVR